MQKMFWLTVDWVNTEQILTYTELSWDIHYSKSTPLVADMQGLSLQNYS